MTVRPGLLQTLLNDFEAAEFLNAEDDYVCKRCTGLVQKALHVQPLGRALLLHLKRFEFTRTGRKLNDVVLFPRTLGLGTARYEFTALIERLGKAMRTGHYVAYVQNANLWRCNDNDVVQIPLQEVEKRQAYLLAYVRTDM